MPPGSSRINDFRTLRRPRRSKRRSTCWRRRRARGGCARSGSWSGGGPVGSSHSKQITNFIDKWICHVCSDLKITEDEAEDALARFREQLLLGKEQERGRAARRREKEAAETEVVEKERGAAETERAAEGLEAAAATAHKFLSQVSLDFYRNNLKTSHFEPNPSRIFPTGEENEDVVGGVVPGDGRGHGAGGQDPGRNREEIQVRAHITS